MHVIKIDIDSQVYGRNFLDIKDFSGNEFAEFEHTYVKEYAPFYVSCKIPIEDIPAIQEINKHGFEFVEFQIREVLNTRSKKKYPVFEPYCLEIVEDEKDLEAILEIAATTFEHDRFTADHKVDRSFSAARYVAYTKQSFTTPDEFLYKLYNKETNEILGFKTHKITGDEVIMFLGGVVPKYKKSAIPVISSYLELNELISKGVKKVTTHISGSNYGVLNLEVKEMGYKVVQGFVVLRKIYAD